MTRPTSRIKHPARVPHHVSRGTPPQIGGFPFGFPLSHPNGTLKTCTPQFVFLEIGIGKELMKPFVCHLYASPKKYQVQQLKEYSFSLGPGSVSFWAAGILANPKRRLNFVSNPGLAELFSFGLTSIPRVRVLPPKDSSKTAASCLLVQLGLRKALSSMVLGVESLRSTILLCTHHSFLGCSDRIRVILT